MLDEADRIFQQDLIASMASALAGALLEEDETRIKLWEKRCKAIAVLAVNVYGEAAALALLDQARAESWRVAASVGA